MKKHLLLLTLLFCTVAYIHAQSFTIQSSPPPKAGPLTVTGLLKDTVNLTSTGYASVSLIRASDSILQTFTRTDQEGRFTLKAPAKGRYLIMVSHPSFAILVDELVVTGDKTDMGEVIMISKRQMLDEVVVTDARAIVIKNDTIEYTADSFKTRAFDNVDELLKRLPGIEVDRNGKIKAYGKEVQNMTVDGEEFFSDDPAVVAQTLRAAAVDKVQVFDKKSDQAAFTGVDDGERIKTINLKLKEDAKQGYFGKVAAGAGPPSFWENQAMINAFKKKRKIAAYGIMSNTNNNGLGWDDRNKYGGNNGSNYSEGDDGEWIMEGDYDTDWGGQFRGDGLPKTWKAGASYSNKWMHDTLSFNGNYAYAKGVTEALNNSRTQYILPESQYITENNGSATSVAEKHNINVSSQYEIDTSSSIKITLGGKYSLNQSEDRNTSASLAMDGSPINSSNSLRTSAGESKELSGSALYRKRFKKAGRSFSANLTGKWTDRTGDGLLNSDYTIYATNAITRIDQRKDNAANSLTGKLRLSYTEPISKVVNLELNYIVGLNNNESENNSFDRTADGSGFTDVYNPLFSSHYVFNNMQNRGGANLRFKFKKLNFAVGGSVADSRFTQEDKLFDTTYSYSYFNFLPAASLSFQPKQGSSLNLRYNGKVRPPQIYMLQPLRNNTDPLNITIGNPALKQSYVHTFNLNYNSYKMMSSTNIWASAGMDIVQNDISQQQYIDESARRTTQFVNVNGNYNAYANVNYGKKMLGITVNPGGYANFNHNNNFINGLPNVNNNYSLSPGLSLGYYKDTTFDVVYRFSPSYNRNISSINPAGNTSYWTFGQSVSGSIQLPLRFTLGTDINWDIRQRLDPQDKNNSVIRWNAYVSKSFLKDRSLVAKVYANDILDQNQGYRRVNSSTMISESFNNTIRRYFLFTLTWNFTHSGVKEKKDDLDIK